ncbi:MAG: VIT and VWA domain-containing protein [Candidatus Obscuribacterales bacterium]|nr:VIT and VWA domain-containing protein [Candidatus Obscuribacterales bacterium]
MTVNHKTFRHSLSLSLSLLSILLLNQAGYSQMAPRPSGGQLVSPGDRSMHGAPEGSGALMAMVGGKQAGQCPLRHTDVKAQVSGYVARVSVKQKFLNPFKDKIEAIYTFPLPENAAVDEMTMRIGDRVIHGNIKKREEARDIYEQAKSRGYVASLLDQERPNIFTQSVANIEPGEQVEIEIKYVDLLPYEAGNFTFNFPTVVGPRFNPGAATGKTGSGRAFDTDIVPDASKITPPVAAEGTRAGHDISIELNIAAGVPISNVQSKLHEVKVTQSGADGAHVVLTNKATIPNKDFVVSWSVAKDSLQSGYLTHRDEKSGYFTLMLLPPKRVTPKEIAPKEMVFLIDCSGSQRGKPLEKAKETMDYIVDHMNPNDSFQILSFNNNVTELAPSPLRNSPETRARAKAFIDGLHANGGTWMAPAVEKVCALPADDHRLRVVVFMTDGYVGNDFQVRSIVRKSRGNARWFPFGTGNSVNRFLIDGIAKDGGGEPEYVLLNSPGPEVGAKFYKRISSPVLTDVKLDFNGVSVKEVYPVEISDVWAERPLYFKGRYTKPGAGTVTLSGFSAGKPYKQELKIVFPEKQNSNEVIKSVWARAKVDRLMAEDFAGAQSGTVNPELKDEIVKTALDYHLMTQYTSFVAVEDTKVTKDGKVKTVPVEVELPDGVSREGALGDVGPAMPRHSRRSLHTSVQSSRQAQAPTGFGAGSAGNGAGETGSGGFAVFPASPMSASPRSAYSKPQSAGVYPGGGVGGYGLSGGSTAGGAAVSGRLMSRSRVADFRSDGSALPPTTMGKFVHQPGDNQYAAPMERAQISSKKRDESSFADKLYSPAPSRAGGESKAKEASKNEDREADDKPPVALLNKLDGTLARMMTNRSKDGQLLKVAVKLTLAKVSDEIKAKLKAAGFEQTAENGKQLQGLVSIANLRKICELAEVLKVESERRPLTR